MASIGTIIPVYNGNNEILTYNDAVTLRVKNVNGSSVLPITPRQLIAALRNGVQIRIIESGNNGGIEVDNGSYVYARLDEIIECSYNTENSCFVFDTASHDYAYYYSLSLDSYFVEYVPDGGDEGLPAT